MLNLRLIVVVVVLDFICKKCATNVVVVVVLGFFEFDFLNIFCFVAETLC